MQFNVRLYFHSSKGPRILEASILSAILNYILTRFVSVMNSERTRKFMAGFNLHSHLWYIVKIFCLDLPAALDVADPSLLLETHRFFPWPFTVSCFPLLGLFSMSFIGSPSTLFPFVARTLPRVLCSSPPATFPWIPHPHAETQLPPWFRWSRSSFRCGAPHHHFQLPLDISSWIFLHFMLIMSKMQISGFLLMTRSSFLTYFPTRLLAAVNSFFSVSLLSDLSCHSTVVS